MEIVWESPFGNSDQRCYFSVLGGLDHLALAPSPATKLQENHNFQSSMNSTYGNCLGISVREFRSTLLFLCPWGSGPPSPGAVPRHKAPRESQFSILHE